MAILTIKRNSSSLMKGSPFKNLPVAGITIRGGSSKSIDMALLAIG
jgi:hypothetical protein